MGDGDLVVFAGGDPTDGGFLREVLFIAGGCGEGELCLYRDCGAEYGGVVVLLPAGGKGYLYGQAGAADRETADTVGAEYCHGGMCRGDYGDGFGGLGL